MSDDYLRLLSVARTGTRFTKKVLGDAGVKYVATHFWGRNNIPRFHRAIITQRDKETTRPRWNQYHDGYQHSFDVVWEEMERYIERNRDSVMLLHIDEPDLREAELKAIGDILGVTLHADFSKKIGEGLP